MLSIHNSWHWDWAMNACLFVQLLHCQDSPANKSSHTRHVHSSGAVNSCLVRVPCYIMMNYWALIEQTWHWFTQDLWWMIESFNIVLKVETSSHLICKNVGSKDMDGIHEVVAYFPTVFGAPCEWMFVLFGSRQPVAWFLQSNCFQRTTHTHRYTSGFTKGRSKFFLPALSLDSWILSVDTTHIPTLYIWFLPNCSLDVKNRFVLFFGQHKHCSLPWGAVSLPKMILDSSVLAWCWRVPGMFILKLKSWIHNCHPGVYSLGIPGWMDGCGVLGMLLDIFQRFLKARWQMQIGGNSTTRKSWNGMKV